MCIIMYKSIAARGCASRYPRRERIPAYRLSYPSGQKVAPVHIKPAFSQKQIQKLAYDSVLYTSNIGILMIYLISQMDENEY